MPQQDGIRVPPEAPVRQTKQDSIWWTKRAPQRPTSPPVPIPMIVATIPALLSERFRAAIARHGADRVLDGHAFMPGGRPKGLAVQSPLHCHVCGFKLEIHDWAEAVALAEAHEARTAAPLFAEAAQ